MIGRSVPMTYKARLTRSPQTTHNTSHSSNHIPPHYRRHRPRPPPRDVLPLARRARARGDGRGGGRAGGRGWGFIFLIKFFIWLLVCVDTAASPLWDDRPRRSQKNITNPPYSRPRYITAGLSVPGVPHGAAGPHLRVHGAAQDQEPPCAVGDGRGGVGHGCSFLGQGLFGGGGGCYLILLLLECSVC